MANLSVENNLSGKEEGTRPADAPPVLTVSSRASLIHIGSLDSFDITAGGKDAARKMLDYIDTGDKNPLKKAIDIYDKIIPNENFGGEYTALQWLCRLFLAPEKERKVFLAHPTVRDWFELLARDNYANLREYLQMKYHFVEIGKDDPDAKTSLRFLEDFILFNNPDRERWDKIAENIYKLGIDEGFNVIDFGCGPGYFTFKFADLVGPSGHVYGIETNDRHISYVNDYLKNIILIILLFMSTGLRTWGCRAAKMWMWCLCALYITSSTPPSPTARGIYSSRTSRSTSKRTGGS